MATEEFLVNTHTDWWQSHPSMAALDTGGFIVTWMHDFGGGGVNQDIFARIYGADGNPVDSSDFGVAQGTEIESQQVVVGLAGNKYMIAWKDAGGASLNDGSGSHIGAIVYTGDNHLPLNGPQFIANSTTANDQSQPAIALLDNGNVILSFTHEFGASDLDVRGRLFNSNGASQGNDFAIDTNAVNEQDSAIVALPDAQYFVAWRDSGVAGETDGSGSHIRGAIMSGTGSNLSGDFVINTSTSGNQSEVDVTVLADGRILAVWTDEGQNPGDTSGFAIRAQIFDQRTVAVNLAGTTGGDDWIGTAFADAMNGGGGNDTMVGGAGRDKGIYSGTRANYTLARNGDASITITDTRGGSPDGVDHLAGFEQLQFSNSLVATLPVYDFYGDFNADILWRDTTTGGVSVWGLSGGQFGQSSQLGGVGGNIKIGGHGDFNGDGISDVLMRDQTTGAVTNWTVSNGQFTGSHALGGVGANIDVTGAGDFNGDGFSDVLLRDSTTGAVTEWGVTNNAFASSHALGGISSNVRIAGIGDFNGDGTADVLFRDTITGAVTEWTVSNHVFTGSHALGGIGSNIDIGGTGDFNGDGTSDILLRNRGTGEVSYWAVVNNAFAGSTQLGGVPGNYQVAGARDIDGNGFADVLLRDTSTGAVGAFKVNNGTFQSFTSLGGAGLNIQFAG